MPRIETPLGAYVSVIQAPEHLGDGVMLMLNMKDPKDHRWAEVYLDPEAMGLLVAGLISMPNYPHRPAE